MQIDFHFSMIYILAKAAGFENQVADKIAWASQFVDDNIEASSTIVENGVEIIKRPTAHKSIDQNNFVFEDGISIWVPFHFLPAGLNETFAEKLVCQKPEINASVNRIIDRYKKEDFCPEYLGIISHVVADTFSHQGFNGMLSNQNDIDDVQPKFIIDKLKNRSNIRQFIKERIEYLRRIFAHIFRVGHVEADNRPDIPYLSWSYTRNGKRKKVNNVIRVEEAIRYIYKLFIEEAKKINCTKTPQASEMLIPQIMEIVRNNNIENLEQRQGKWLSIINGNEFDFITETDVSYDESKVPDERIREFVKEANKYRKFVVDTLLPDIFSSKKE